MKAASFVFLLAVCSVMTLAQNVVDPPADVTIGMSEDTPEYCLGPYPRPRFLFQGPRTTQRGPDDITLWLPLKLQYENHRVDTIILPAWIHTLTQMTVPGQNGATVLRNARNDGMDVKRVMAMSGPDAQFSIVAGGKNTWYTGLEGVVIPVLERSSGLDLRGKTIQIVMTRDFRSLEPELVKNLNEKWKAFGTSWVGVVKSNTMQFQIPKEPLTRDCMVTLVSQ